MLKTIKKHPIISLTLCTVLASPNTEEFCQVLVYTCKKKAIEKNGEGVKKPTTHKCDSAAALQWNLKRFICLVQ